MVKVIAGLSATVLAVVGLSQFAPSSDQIKPAAKGSSTVASSPTIASASAVLAHAAPETPPAYAPKVMHDPDPNSPAATRRMFMSAARAAWAAVQRSAAPATGLVNSQPDWQYPTTWDIASTLASNYSARGLGFITEQEYLRMTAKLLNTINHLRLYKKTVAYGRAYDAKTAELVTDNGKPTDEGTGYSAIDVGRLLIWLKIIAEHDKSLAAAAQSAALRIDPKFVIRNGYLHGEQVISTGFTEYQEGRLSYEQYAASGFDLWGMKADSALNGEYNAKPIQVMGIPLFADKRGLDRLTSEAMVLHGLELGWPPILKELAWQTLSLQAKRYTDTGILTVASEDAIKVAPHYFYYYCIYCDGKAFTINVHSPGVDLDEPRWLSSKAVFAWHALLPSKYTALTIAAVKPALEPSKGWATGVFEKTLKTTDTFSLNTQAVILEAALYNKLGQPLLTGGSGAHTVAPAAKKTLKAAPKRGVRKAAPRHAPRPRG